MDFEMPKPTEEHRKLARLAGTWTGEEKLHPSPWDPQGGPAAGKTTTRVDLDGFFLLCDYVQERGGEVSYRGHGVFGYDPQEKVYTMYWFDSMMPVIFGAAKGTWAGNTLAFEQSHPMGHSRYVYTFDGESRYTFQILMSQDGKTWAPFMEGRYTRR